MVSTAETGRGAVLSTRSAAPSTELLPLRTLVGSGLVAAAGFGYLLSESLVTPSNVAVLGASVAWWTLLWRLLVLVDGRVTIGVVRTYFAFHILFVQVGILAIYFASQRPQAEARFILGFDVEPSLLAVVVPSIAMAWFLAGVLTYARRYRPTVAEVVVIPTTPTSIMTSRTRRLVALLGLGVAYVLVAMAVRRSVPLLEVLRGADSQAVRLEAHYGDAPYLFHPSIVHQVTLVLAPFAAMLLWETSIPGTRRRWMTYAAGALALLLLLNSLERTTMVTTGLWFALVVYYRRRRLPLSGLAVLLGGFVMMTVVLHGLDGDVVRNQVFRRFFLVNAMVNYFALEHFPADLGLLNLTSYFDYLTKGVLGGGSTFAKALISQVLPGQTVGTAPVGAVVEAWANVGWLMGPILFAQGGLFAHLDHRFRGRIGDPLSRVYFAGLVLFLAGSSYAGLLSILFSGGVLPLTVLFLALRARQRRIAATTS